MSSDVNEDRNDKTPERRGRKPRNSAMTQGDVDLVRGTRSYAPRRYEEGVPETDDEAFDHAVDAEVKRRLQGMELAAFTKVAEAETDGGVPPDVLKMMQALALSIKEIASQGDPNAVKPVPPAEMKRREKARQELLVMLEEAYKRKEQAHYSLIRPVYLADRLIEASYVNQYTKRREPQVIYWPDVPNDAMVPVNELAKRIHAKWQESLGEMPLDVEMPPAKRAFLDAGSKMIVKGDDAQRQDIPAYQPRPGGESLDPSQRPQRDQVQVFGTVAPAVQVQG